MISSQRGVMLGAVRQELLSGISDLNAFNKLKDKLKNIVDFVPQTSDYELAAEFFNSCRKNGIQGSHIDYLICAVSVKNGWAIFTEDTDFLNYQEYIPIKIHKIH